MDSTEKYNLADSLPERVETMNAAARQWFLGIQQSTHAFQAPVFRVASDTISALPLYAPMEIEGGLKVAFSFLHQLKIGGRATYKIEVEHSGEYTLAFEPPNLTGTYRVSTKSGSSEPFKGGRTTSLTMKAGLQELTLEVIDSDEQSLKQLMITPGSR